MEDIAEDRATEEQIVSLQNIIKTFKNTECKTEKFLYERIEKAIDINNTNKEKASDWINFFNIGRFNLVYRSKDSIWPSSLYANDIRRSLGFNDSKNLNENFFIFYRYCLNDKIYGERKMREILLRHYREIPSNFNDRKNRNEKIFGLSVIETLRELLKIEGEEEKDPLYNYYGEYPDKYKQTISLVAVDTVLFAKTYDR